MRLVAVAGAVGLLVGCTAPAAPPAPVTPKPAVAICPPSPPEGSEFVCAPSKLCTANQQVRDLNDSPIGALLSQKWRNFLYHSGLAVDDLCQP